MQTLRTLTLALGLFILSIFPFLNAQFTGGYDKGTTTPAAASQADLSGGAVGDDVNLFTGTLNLSYNFGSINTMSSLSFPVSLQFESSAKLGFNHPQNSGIPYGEGWSLVNGSITVDNLTYDFIPGDTTVLGFDPVINKHRFNADEAKQVGQIWFANPRLSLPNGISGKLVYKYPHPEDERKHVYILNTFEQYVEAVFDGENWEVVLDDGTVYRFEVKQYSHRNPSGFTAKMDDLPYDQSVPRTQVDRWLLSEISNPNHANSQRIVFGYEMQGAIDFYPQFAQASVREGIYGIQSANVAIISQANQAFHQSQPYCVYQNCNIGDTIHLSDRKLSRVKAYRDIYLKTVYSTDADGLVYQRLDLKHKSWRPEYELKPYTDYNQRMHKGKFLRLDDSKVMRIDSLYSSKTVWFWGLDHAYSQFHPLGERPEIDSVAQLRFDPSWRRYRHPLSNENPLLEYADQANPGTPFATEFRQSFSQVAPGLTPNFPYKASTEATNSIIPALAFEHSVIESPAIPEAVLTTMPSGDLYQLRTLIKVPEGIDMNFDVNVVSGMDFTSNLQRSINGTNYEFERHLTPGPTTHSLDIRKTGYTVYSSFQNPVKWNPQLQREANGFRTDPVLMATGDWFQLPNLPNQYDGIRVQIGPGADNLNYNEADYNDYGYPRYYNNTGATLILDNEWEFPTSTWFGTGAPWSPMHFTDRWIQPRGNHYTRGQSGDRDQYWHYPVDPINLAQTFSGAMIDYMGPNQPTAVTHEKLNANLNLTGSYFWNHTDMQQAHDYDQQDDSHLRNMEIVRVSKNPWMLDSVIFWQHNEKYGEEMTRLATYKLNYMVEQTPVLNNFDPTSGNYFPSGSIWKIRNGEIQYRNIYQLLSVERLPIDLASNHAYKNAEVPTTHFVYAASDTSSPYQEELYLISEVWNELGGRTVYQYFPTADTFDLYNSSQQITQTGSQLYAIIGKGSYYHQRYRVKTKSVEDKDGLHTWEYQYDNEQNLWVQYPVDAHFRNSFNRFFKNHRRGFEKVTVISPPVANSNGSKTEYYHYVNSATTEDTLLFGRVHKTIGYDDQGREISNSEVIYSATLAYKNGYYYHPWDDYRLPPYAISTPNNHVYSYEGRFWFPNSHTTGISPAPSRLFDAWFIRPVREISTVTDPVSGHAVTTEMAFTHYDWDITQNDPEGDYLRMYNPMALPNQQPINYLAEKDYAKWRLGRAEFQYPQEPSWQLASATTSTTAMPGAYSRTENYYLWDIAPLLSTNQVAWENWQFEYAFRPFHLARNYRIRSVPYETRTITHNGHPDEPAYAQSTYFWYETYYDIAGDFELFIDTTDHCAPCDTMLGDPIYKGQRQVIAFCFDDGQDADMKRLLSETIDDPRFVQDTSGDWHYFPITSVKSLTFDDLEALSLNPMMGLGGTCSAGVVLDTLSHPLYFGQMVTHISDTITPDEIQCTNRNYGRDCHADSLVEATKRKKHLLGFFPYKLPGDQEEYHDVPPILSDSLLNVIFDPNNDPGVSPYKQIFIDMLDRQFFLSEVHVQADTILTEHWNLIDYDSPATNTGPNYRSSIHDVFEKRVAGSTFNDPYRWSFKPSFPTIRVYKVHRRNMYGQVVDESDSRHLHTIYEYLPGQYYNYFDNNGVRHSYLKRQFAGLPVSVTQSDYGRIEQASIFDYNRDYSLKAVTSPNQETAEYAYDDFKRLASTSLNGDTTANFEYQTWKNDRVLSWHHRTLENFSVSKVYDGVHPDPLEQHSYIDPLGRTAQTITAATSPQGWDKRFTGNSIYDDWGRVIKTFKPFAKNTAALPGLDTLAPASTFAEVLYENDARSRVLESAKPGNAVSGSHTSELSYGIVSLAGFIAETGITNAERNELWPVFGQGSVPQLNLWMTQTRIFRTEAKDEDGNTAVTFANALGQQIATMRWADPMQTPQSRVLTLYIYGSNGQVIKAIAPNKLPSTTRHNYLGMPIASESPDAGLTKMIYTTGGELAVYQDENLRAAGRFKRFEYDRLGREIRAFTAAAPSSGGTYPYLFPDQQQPPFYDIHTLTDPNEDLFDGYFHHSDTLTLASGQGYQNGFAFPLISPGSTNQTLIREIRYDFPNKIQPRGYHFPYLFNTQLHSQTVSKLESQRNTVGRVSALKTYNHLGNLMEVDFFSYNDEGHPEWHIKQFEPDGIVGGVITGRKGRVDLLEYARYDLTGKLLTLNIDLNFDDTLDIQHHYRHNAFGQLAEVYANRTHLEDAGQKVADYQYDPVTGLVSKVRYFVFSEDCNQSFVADSIEYDRDQDQNRLTRIHSQFFDYKLFYENQDPNSGNTVLGSFSSARNVEYDEHWNGNVNGTWAEYKLPLNAGITGFDRPTRYGYKYDGLSRLVQADATVDENFIRPLGASFFHQGSGLLLQPPRPRTSWYGDCLYEYDLAGNLTRLRRYNYYHNARGDIGQEWLYQYTSGTNQLRKLAGFATQSVDFTYDGNGNLTSDSKRDLSGFRYTHSNLPAKFSLGNETMRYFYGANGMRSFKLVEDYLGQIRREYYLRDASGQTLAIVNPDSGIADFQIYGLGLIAEWTHRDSTAQDSSSGGGGNTGNGNPNKTEPLTRKQRQVRRIVEQALITAPALIPLAIHAVEGGASVYAFPVVVALQPVIAEVTERLQMKRLRAITAAVADPRPLAMEQDTTGGDTLVGNLKFFVKDHLGNTRITYIPFLEQDAVTQNCAVNYFFVSVVDYYPYGKNLRSWFNDGHERFQSTEHERDLETGLDYRGARYYDGEYARFLGVDPLAGVQLDLGPYNYVNGNPVLLVDPDGRMAGGPGGPSTAGLTIHSVNKMIDAFSQNDIDGDGKFSAGEFGNATWDWQSGNVHFLLDGAGMVPGYGEPFDLLNAGIYANEGKKFEASLSGAAAIPFLGWAATSVKWADQLKTLAKLGGEGFSNLKYGGKVLNPGSGPEAGVLEISDRVKSVKSFLNWKGKKGEGIEFVFDTERKIFAMGKTKGRFGSPHVNLANAIEAKNWKNVVGGSVIKRDGKFMFTEHSGHFGKNWTDESRKLFSEFMQEKTGINVFNKGYTPY